MDIRVLGEVTLYGPDGPVVLERIGERILLAVLAIRAGQDVDTATLLRLLGDGGGVEQITARTLTDYITAVRAAIEQAGGSRGMLPDARRRRGTYRLDIDPNRIDYHRFQQHSRTGRSHAAAGDHHAAAQRQDSAHRPGPDRTDDPTRPQGWIRAAGHPEALPPGRRIQRG